MESLPSLITDLALILITAGTVALLFKRLKQPLVLGYIVAGFLVGPHFSLTPSVSDVNSIETWASIGVIFLMFSLGLEFSFKKIIKMGGKPIAAACLVMICMITVGSTVGHAFGWSRMDSLFLGGMLAMSSTTIIYKALGELGMRQRKFAGEVLSVLVIEDILGILLMVALSAMAVSRHFEGTELFGSLLKLGFFLVLWFIVGVYLVPLFLKRTNAWLNRETLLIVASGLCFLLVVIAAKVGYSTAFGAFMMGSILAETLEAENIERVISPIKDLFGAIFFVSVGMLVDPQVLVDYWLPIVVITLAVLLGQAIFGTGSFLVSGQSLRVSLQCGFSLAQIGEFAFIIASLGVSLKVTSEFLYPVVVAVSIITTFLTPYMMRAAKPTYELVEKTLPDRILGILGDNRGSDRSEQQIKGPWRKHLLALFQQMGAYLTLVVAVIGISFATLLPICRKLLGHWPGNAVCGLLTLIAIAPFLRAIVMRKNHSRESQQIRQRGRSHRVIIWGIFLFRYALASAAIYYVLNFLSPLSWMLHIAVALLLMLGIIASRRVKMRSIRMERTFMDNLRSRDIHAHSKDPVYTGRLLSRDVHLAQLAVPTDSCWGGKMLKNLNLTQDNVVMIAAIVRGDRRINIPDGNTMLFPGDLLEVISDDTGLQAFEERLSSEIAPLVHSDSAHRLHLRRLTITTASPFCGKTLQESGIRNDFQCMVIGVENESGALDIASSDYTFKHNDTIWIVGEDSALAALMAANQPPQPEEKAV